MIQDKIHLSHGGGGMLTNELITSIFLPYLKNPYLEEMQDSAVFSIGDAKYAISTDSYVINPVFFPGGDICLSRGLRYHKRDYRGSRGSRIERQRSTRV